MGGKLYVRIVKYDTIYSANQLRAFLAVFRAGIGCEEVLRGLGIHRDSKESYTCNSRGCINGDRVGNALLRTKDC